MHHGIAVEPAGQQTILEPRLAGLILHQEQTNDHKKEGKGEPSKAARDTIGFGLLVFFIMDWHASHLDTLSGSTSHPLIWMLVSQMPSVNQP